MGDTSYSETFTYGKTNGLLATHTPAVGNKLTFGYDNLQRLTGVTGGIYGKTYIYRDISGTNTTTQVSQLKYDLPTDITFGYTYDVLGNIATYTENGTTYTYAYDAQNQLTSVKTNGTTTHQYSYDAAGNILTASDGTGSHTYTYSDGVWKDLLVAYDGHAISYDGSGNPTTYYNGKEWTMAWAEGRRLVSANGDGKSLTFTYDSEGLRLTKKVGSTTYNYSYAGGKLLRQTGGGNTLDFFYDSAGLPYALKYNGTLYYYITNLQGDVLHIVNTSGTPVVSYTYDPYGKPLTTTGTEATTLGAHNPLRYRGYVYDTETGLYYLQSRYYDPEIGRFINADGLISINTSPVCNNLFVYCCNNPILYIDETGQYYTQGQIHDLVVKDICEKNEKESTGTYIVYDIPIFRNKSNKKKGKLSTYGFCDFFDSTTGEAWEVKRFGGGPTCSIEAATIQLSNYVYNGTLKYFPELELTMGGNHSQIADSWFFKQDSDGEGTYFVYYWDTGFGIVYYDYMYFASTKEALYALAAIAAVATAAATGNLALGVLSLM